VPALVAVISFSIFIASRMSKTCPVLTWAPGVSCCYDCAGIGQVMVPGAGCSWWQGLQGWGAAATGGTIRGVAGCGAAAGCLPAQMRVRTPAKAPLLRVLPRYDGVTNFASKFTFISLNVSVIM
jgi:hypothetical protein